MTPYVLIGMELTPRIRILRCRLYILPFSRTRHRDNGAAAWRVFFRRRKGLIFKFIIGVPILWFSTIGFMVVMSGGGIPDINSVDPAGGRGRNNQDRRLRYDSKLTKLPENVIEVPNPDRLQFEERVKREAGREAGIRVEVEDRGRKLNGAGEEDGLNRETEFPKRTRLKKPVEDIDLKVTKGVNKTQIQYEALEVVFHLPPDDPDGPGKYEVLYFYISLQKEKEKEKEIKVQLPHLRSN